MPQGPRSAAELEAAFAEAVEEPGARSGPLRAGQDFGTRYTVLKLLGSGGMGVVYQALDRDLNVPVALKVLRPSASNPRVLAELQRRFKTELLLARRVTHKHVIRIHDIGEIDGIKFITMPFVRGQDLGAILKQGPLPVVTALRYARQLAAGLAAAHAAGVIHRDLKPANVMIDDDGNALLMDFGIARSSLSGSPQRTVAGAVVGTAAYMAPEQARGERVDERADIYAFGLILHEMLCGPRFMPRGAVADLYARLTAPPAPARAANSAIPEALDAIVTRCVQPQPAERYQTALELAAALAALSRRGHGPVAGSSQRRRTWARCAAAAALLGLLTGGGCWTFEQGRRNGTGDVGGAPHEIKGRRDDSARADRHEAVRAVAGSDPEVASVGTVLRAPAASLYSDTAAPAPEPPPPYVQRQYARAAVAALRSPEGARRSYARLAGTGPRGAAYAAAGVADLEMMRRHHADAAEMLERAIAMDIRAKNLAAAAPKYLALAEARIGEGRRDMALVAVESALDVSRHETVLLPAARLYISLDRPHHAEQLSYELAEGGRRGPVYSEIVDADLALHRGDSQRAIDTLTNVLVKEDLWLARYLRGTAYLEAQRYDEASAEFAACRMRRDEGASLYFNYLPTLRYLAMLEEAVARVRAESATLNVASTGR